MKEVDFFLKLDKIPVVQQKHDDSKGLTNASVLWQVTLKIAKHWGYNSCGINW